MNNVAFLNILPYIWISYFINTNISNQNKANSIHLIKKFINIKKFSQILRLDQDASFWNNNKENYIFDIKTSIEEKNRNQLKSVYQKYIKIIKNNYKKGILTLIICPKNNELIIGLLILFFKEMTELPISKIYPSIVSKFEKETNTTLGSNIKKILINK